jgi:inosine/guanosine/xanthosine phosphorylase family protein
MTLSEQGSKSSRQPIVNFDPRDTASQLRKQTALRPTLAIVLGSGFQHAIDEFQPSKEVPFREIPGFPPVGVSGHAGKIVFGRFGDTTAVLLKGRAHFYEGIPMERITFPIRALAELGIKTVLLTNAAGGINRSMKPGSLMALTDHLNFMGDNPLRGVAAPGRAQFVDLTQVYDPALVKLSLRAAKLAKLAIRPGVYLALSGPSYETPAEIRAYAKLGADAVGMSTVPEAIVARQCGLRVAGISCIANLAAGLGKGTLSHQEVLDVASRQAPAMAKFLAEFAKLHADAS